MTVADLDALMSAKTPIWAKALAEGAWFQTLSSGEKLVMILRNAGPGARGDAELAVRAGCDPVTVAEVLEALHR